MTETDPAALDELQAPPEPSSLRLVSTLTFAGLCAGLLLATVQAITLPAIEANQAAALREAVYEVVPGTKTFCKLVLTDGAFVPASGTEAKDATAVYCAFDEEGAHLGFAIPGAGPGFQDTIKLLYGYDPAAKNVIGMKVLESRETPGLGDKIFKDDAFVAEFAALAIEPEITVVPGGTGSAPHHVDGITGATISSVAVVKIINQQNQALLAMLPSGDDLPPAPPPSTEAAK